MGFGRTPSPRVDPELAKQREAEQKRLAEEEAKIAARKEESERVRVANLRGQQSLQDEELEGFTGYRRKSMGKSIRS